MSDSILSAEKSGSWFRALARALLVLIVILDTILALKAKSPSELPLGGLQIAVIYCSYRFARYLWRGLDEKDDQK